MSSPKSPVKSAQSLKEDAFFDACRQGRTQDVLTLLKSGIAMDLREQDSLGLHQTALHQAARNGKVDTVRALIDHGAEVDATNTRGQTALHEAAMGGFFEVCRLLIHCGADLNAVDNRKRTPLYWAAEEDREKFQNHDHKIVFLELVAQGAVYAGFKPGLFYASPEIRRMEKLTRLQAATQMHGVETLASLLVTDAEPHTLPQRVEAILGSQETPVRDDTAFVLRSWLNAQAARAALASMENISPTAGVLHP